jgi:hypothetical protein
MFHVTVTFSFSFPLPEATGPIAAAPTTTLGGVMLALAERECFHTGLPVASDLAPIFGLVDLAVRTYLVVLAVVSIGLLGLDDDVLPENAKCLTATFIPLLGKYAFYPM